MRAILFPDLQDYSVVLNPGDFTKLLAKRQIVDWLVILGEQQRQKLCCAEMFNDDIHAKITRVWLGQGFIQSEHGIFIKESREKFEFRIFHNLLKKIQLELTPPKEYQIKFTNKSKLHFYHPESIDGRGAIHIHTEAMKKM